MQGMSLALSVHAVAPSGSEGESQAAGSSRGDVTMADDLTRDGLKNQGEGMIDQAKGKVRNAVGGLTGDTSEQLKGKGEELKGKVQRKIGEKQVDLDNDV